MGKILYCLVSEVIIKSFTNKKKDIRKKENLTQEEFAEKVFVSRNAVAKWETNRGYPDIENLITISDVFKISLDELIKEDNKVKNGIYL